MEALAIRRSTLRRRLLMASLAASWLPGALAWVVLFPQDERSSNEVVPEHRNSGGWIIYPGTKWCGSGDQAEDYDDLGEEAATDMCCRKHDYCPDIIEARQSKHGLNNSAYYTRLNCDCDEEFRQCLKNANTRTSQEVGFSYFTVLNTQCFREDYPVKGCRKYTPFGTRCQEYEYDSTAPKKWQWFDVPCF